MYVQNCLSATQRVYVHQRIIFQNLFMYNHCNFANHKFLHTSYIQLKKSIYLLLLSFCKQQEFSYIRHPILKFDLCTITLFVQPTGVYVYQIIHCQNRFKYKHCSSTTQGVYVHQTTKCQNRFLYNLLPSATNKYLHIPAIQLSKLIYVYSLTFGNPQVLKYIRYSIDKSIYLKSLCF
jgi:hypothetical protein